MLEQISRIQTELSNFSPSSKIWIYFSDKSFENVRDEIEISIDKFVSDWKSHGDRVTARGFTIGQYIIILCADEEFTNVSGCSTDSSVHFIQSLGKSFELDLFDRTHAYLVIDSKMKRISTSELKDYPEDVLAFNPFFRNLAEWREKFIEPLSQSMWKRLL